MTAVSAGVERDRVRGTKGAGVERKVGDQPYSSMSMAREDGQSGSGLVGEQVGQPEA